MELGPGTLSLRARARGELAQHPISTRAGRVPKRHNPSSVCNASEAERAWGASEAERAWVAGRVHVLIYASRSHLASDLLTPSPTTPFKSLKRTTAPTREHRTPRAIESHASILEFATTAGHSRLGVAAASECGFFHNFCDAGLCDCMVATRSAATQPVGSTDPLQEFQTYR